MASSSGPLHLGRNFPPTTTHKSDASDKLSVAKIAEYVNEHGFFYFRDEQGRLKIVTKMKTLEQLDKEREWLAPVGYIYYIAIFAAIAGITYIVIDLCRTQYAKL